MAMVFWLCLSASVLGCMTPLDKGGGGWIHCFASCRILPFAVRAGDGWRISNTIPGMGQVMCFALYIHGMGHVMCAAAMFSIITMSVCWPCFSLYDECFCRTPLQMSACAGERTGGPQCSVQTCTRLMVLACSLQVFMTACDYTRAHVVRFGDT